MYLSLQHSSFHAQGSGWRNQCSLPRSRTQISHVGDTQTGVQNNGFTHTSTHLYLLGDSSNCKKFAISVKLNAGDNAAVAGWISICQCCQLLERLELRICMHITHTHKWTKWTNVRSCHIGSRPPSQRLGPHVLLLGTLGQH